MCCSMHLSAVLCPNPGLLPAPRFCSTPWNQRCGLRHPEDGIRKWGLINMDGFIIEHGDHYNLLKTPKSGGMSYTPKPRFKIAAKETNLCMWNMFGRALRSENYDAFRMPHSWCFFRTFLDVDFDLEGPKVHCPTPWITRGVKLWSDLTKKHLKSPV